MIGFILAQHIDFLNGERYVRNELSGKKKAWMKTLLTIKIKLKQLMSIHCLSGTLPGTFD